MPLSSDNQRPTEPTASQGLCAPALPGAADSSAAATRLGTFLMDPRSGQLLASDAQAAELFSFDPDATVSVNAKPDDAKAASLRTLFPDLSQQEWISLLGQHDKRGRFLTTLVRKRDGSKLLAQLNFLPLTGPQGDLFLLLAVEPLHTESSIISHRDALTGLPDRRELVEYHQQWQRAAGVRPKPFALLFMDLDDFKRINDRHGHTVGDHVLTVLAQRWLDSIRDGDIVVRYGGDEFVVLLSGITDREEVEPIIARLKQVTAAPIPAGNERLEVGITIGVTLSDNTSTSLEQVIHAADRDMYASKRRG